MRFRHFAGLAVTAVLLAACGGGGGGGGGGGSGGGQTPSGNIPISLSVSSGSASFNEGQSTDITFNTVATGSNTVSTPVVPDLQYDADVIESVTAVSTGASRYNVAIKTRGNLEPGQYTGQIRFRLCQQSACTRVYGGSAVSFNYSINVKLNDWETYQRDMKHTAYVPTMLDPAKFSYAWEWGAPVSGAVSPVVTSDGRIYFTYQRPPQNTVEKESRLIALNESDGSTAWVYEMGKPAKTGLPTVSAGKIFVGAVSDRQNGSVYAVDAVNGHLLKTFGFETQWDNPFPPAVFGDNILLQSGRFGDVLYNYSYAGGSQKWSQNTSYMVDGTNAVATDGKYAYYYNMNSLNLYNMETGILEKSILDPHYVWRGYSHNSGVLIGSDGFSFSFSGSTSLPGQLMNEGHYSLRPFVAYDTNLNKVAWKIDGYYTNPAYKDKVLYISKNKPSSLDAISQETGDLLWSWTPPEGEVIYRNTVVVKNLVFVSTNKKVYAIGLDDHQVKWSYGEAGTISLSANYMLYISVDYVPPYDYDSGETVPPTRSLSRIVAIRLK